MWRAFAVFYNFGFILGVVVIANLLLANAERELALAFAALICAGVVIAFLTAIGLLGYAFDLKVRPPGLWRPFGWLLGVWLVGLSLIGATNFMPRPGSKEGIIGLVWLLLVLLVNYLSWLGVWRYGRRATQHPSPAS